MEKTRKFRCGEGREVYLPASLTEGPHNTRLESGEIIDLEERRIRIGDNSRFVNMALRWGDLVELKGTPTAPAAPAKE